MVINIVRFFVLFLSCFGVFFKVTFTIGTSKADTKLEGRNTEVKQNEVSRGTVFPGEISTNVGQKHYQNYRKLSLSGRPRDQMFCYKFFGCRWFTTALCHLCTSNVCRVKAVF